MLSDAETICAALLAAPEVSSIIGTRLYPNEPPERAVFPCAVYSESQIPAGSADNAEVATSITFDFEVYQSGRAWPLAIAVNDVMISLGYVRVSVGDAGTVGNNVHQVSMQFQNVKEV